MDLPHGPFPTHGRTLKRQGEPRWVMDERDISTDERLRNIESELGIDPVTTAINRRTEQFAGRFNGEVVNEGPGGPAVRFEDGDQFLKALTYAITHGEYEPWVEIGDGYVDFYPGLPVNHE